MSDADGKDGATSQPEEVQPEVELADEEPAVMKRPGAKVPKSKATPKSKGKSAAKKPASAKAVIKKPAMKPEPRSKPKATWACGSKSIPKHADDMDDEEQAEEEQAEDDPECEEGGDKFEMCETTKDRSKDFKFKTLLAQGSLPAWLVTAWNKACKMKTGRVAEQRRLVNLCLDRTPGGTLLLNLDKPQLQQTKESCYFTCEWFCTCALSVAWVELAIHVNSQFLVHGFVLVHLLVHGFCTCELSVTCACHYT